MNERTHSSDFSVGESRWAAQQFRTPGSPGAVIDPPRVESGFGTGVFIGGVVTVVLVGVGLFGLMFATPVVTPTPELVDLHRPIDYRDHPITGAALSKDLQKLFVSSDGGGLTSISTDVFRIRTERATGSNDGPSTDRLGSLTASFQGGLAVETLGDGKGLDWRNPDGEWRTLLSAAGVPGVTASDILTVIGHGDVLVFILRQGRLLEYHKSDRRLRELDVEGNIPQPVTSAALTSRGGSWQAWLAAGGGVTVVEPSGQGEVKSKPSLALEHEKIVELATAGSLLFARTEREALYALRDRWEPLMGGRQWPGLTLERVRFAMVSHDSSRLWLINSEAAGETGVGAYDFERRRWAYGSVPSDHGLVPGCAAPCVSPDGHQLILPMKKAGFLVLELRDDSIVPKLHNSIGGESVRHLHSDAQALVITTSRSKPESLHVRLFSWSEAVSQAETYGQVLRESVSREVSFSDLVDVFPRPGALILVTRDGRLVRYDLTKRGCGAPIQLRLPSPEGSGADESLGSVVATTCHGDTLWLLDEKSRLLSCGIESEGHQGSLTVHVRYDGGMMPKLQIERAIVVDGGFDALLADGSAWNYDFAKGWSKVGENLAPQELVRLSGSLFTRTKDGLLALRLRERWTTLAPQDSKKLTRLVPGVQALIGQRVDGSWGRLSIETGSGSWSFDSLIAAVPSGRHELAPPISSVTATYDESGLVVGDTDGLLHYTLETHAWRRVLENESGAPWKFVRLGERAAALATRSGTLYDVDLGRAPRARKVRGKFVDVAASSDRVLAVSKDGTLEQVVGPTADFVPLSIAPTSDLSSRGPLRAATVRDNEVAVVDASGKLLWYSLEQGAVKEVAGPWAGQLVEVRSAGDVVVALDAAGALYRSRSFRGPFTRVRSSGLVGVDLLEADHGVAVVDQAMGLSLVLSEGPIRPLAGGARDKLSPGEPSSVLIEGDRVTIGGSRGIAVRSPEARCLSAAFNVGAVRNFHVLDGEVYCTSANGLFRRQGDQYERVGPPDLEPPQRLVIQGEEAVVALDSSDRPWRIRPDGSAPEALSLFGVEDIHDRSDVVAAIAINSEQAVLGLRSGGLLLLDSESWCSYTLGVPTGEAIRYLGRLGPRSFCVVTESGGSYSYERFSLTGFEARSEEKRGDLRDWAILDSREFSEAAGNVALLSDRSAVLRVEPFGLVAELDAADGPEPIKVRRVHRAGGDLYLLGLDGELVRYEPRRRRGEVVANGIADVWPCATQLVKLHTDGRLSTSREIDVLRAESRDAVRGDGESVAVGVGQRVDVLRPATGALERTEIDAEGAGPAGDRVAFWATSASEDRVFVLENGNRILSYDVRTAVWEEYGLFAGERFDTLLGGNRRPAILWRDGQAFDIRSQEMHDIVAPPALRVNGEVAWLDRDGVVRIGDGDTTWIPYAPRPIVEPNSTVSWAVRLAGGTALGLNGVFVWWPGGAERPSVTTMSIPSRVTHRVTAGSPGPVAWIFSDDGAADEVTPNGVRRLSVRAPLDAIGVLDNTLVWFDERGLWGEAPDGQPVRLMSRSRSDLAADEQRVWASEGVGYVALTEGELSWRRANDPGGEWGALPVGLGSITSVSSCEEVVLVRGKTLGEEERTVVVRVGATGAQVDHGAEVTSEGLLGRDGKVEVKSSDFRGWKSVDDIVDGALPEDRWSALRSSNRGLVLVTEAGGFVIRMGEAGRVEVEREEEGLEISSFAVPAELPAHVRNEGSVVEIEDGDELRVFDLASGMLPAELPVDLGVADDRWVLRMLSGDTFYLVGTDLEPVSEPGLVHADPRSNQVAGRFSFDRGRLSWSPRDSVEPIELAKAPSGFQRFLSDQVLDYLPAASGVYVLSPAGLWLWRDGLRVPVVSDATVVQGKQLLLDVQEGQCRRVVGDGRRHWWLEGTEAEPAEGGAFVRHPLEGSGSQNSLRWATTEKGVRFELRVQGSNTDQWRVVRWMGVAFEHELFTAVRSRGGELFVVARGNLEYSLSDPRSTAVRVSTPWDRPDSPARVPVASLEFRRDPSGLLSPWMSQLGGEDIQVQRSTNGQFSCHRVSTIIEGQARVYVVTDSGVVECNRDLSGGRLLPRLPSGFSRCELALGASGNLFARSGGRTIQLVQSEWRAAGQDTPFDRHRAQVTVIGPSRWRSAPDSAAGFGLEYRFSDNTWRNVRFDSTLGGFAMDIMRSGSIEEVVRVRGGRLEYQTAEVWLLSTDGRDTTLLAESPAEMAPLTQKTVDGRLELARHGASRIVIDPGMDPLGVEWSVEAGRLAHDRVRGLTSSAAQRGFTVASDQGVREIQFTNGRGGSRFHELGGAPVTRVVSRGDRVFAESGDYYERTPVGWSKTSQSSFDAALVQETAAAGRLGRLHWIKQSGAMVFAIQDEDGTGFGLALDSLGFKLDRPWALLEHRGLWLAADQGFFEVPEPGRGIESLLREGDEPTTGGVRALESLEPVVVVEREGELWALDNERRAWSVKPELHENAWAGFANSHLLVHSPGVGEVTVDWQPPRENGLPDRVCLETRSGQFAHDRLLHFAATDRDGEFLLATEAGVALRRVDQGLRDLRAAEASITWLLPSAEGIIGRGADKSWRIETGKPLGFAAVADPIPPQVIHDGEFFKIERLPDGVGNFRVLERLLGDRHVVSRDPFSRGQFPGDRVGAAFLATGGLWMATGRGVAWYEGEPRSGRYQLKPALRRPEGHDGAMAGRLELDASHDIESFPAWQGADSLWVAFAGDGAPWIARLDGPDRLEHRSVSDFAEARRQRQSRPGWSWSHVGERADLQVWHQAHRGELVDCEVAVEAGGFDVDITQVLRRGGKNVFATCPVGARALTEDGELELVLLPRGSRRLGSTQNVVTGEDGRAYLVDVASSESYRAEVGSKSFELAPGARVEQMLRTLHHDGVWHFYRNVHETLHLVRRDLGLTLPEERMMVEGQLAFDRPAFLAGAPDHVWLVTYATVERCDDAGLDFVLPLEETPTACGIREDTLALELGETSYQLKGDELVGFDGSVEQPWEHLSTSIGDVPVVFRDGLVVIGEQVVGQDAPPPRAAFESAGRLWLVSEESVHWIRLESRWRSRAMAQAGDAP